MKTFFVFLAALFLSSMVGGGLIAWVADATRGSEVFIIAFVAQAIVALVSIVVFAITYVLAPRQRPIDWAAIGLVVVFCSAPLVLLAHDYWTIAQPASKEEAPLFLSVLGGSFLTVLVQWWFVRRRAVKLARDSVAG